KIGVKTMELDSNCHSVFLLYYHLVLVVKYRRNVFDDTISKFAKDMFDREEQGQKSKSF
ncbi:transposase, partial [Fusobacterium necrophorum BFTR-1]